MRTERREILDTLWELMDKTLFFSVYETLQSNYKVEAKIYELQICEFLDKHEGRKDLTWLLIQARLTQNNSLLISESFIGEIIAASDYSFKIPKIFQAIFNSQKSLIFFPKNDERHIKEFLSRRLLDRLEL
jgi:hypothetical protein